VRGCSSDPKDEGEGPVKTRGREAIDQGKEMEKYPNPLRGWWWYEVKKGWHTSL